MHKYTITVVLTCACLLVATPVVAGQGSPDTDLAHWGLEITHPDSSHLEIKVWVNPDFAIQKPGAEGNLICESYTLTGRENSYKRRPFQKPVDLANPNVDIGIDAKGMDRIEMTRTGDGWATTGPITCGQVKTGFNVIFSFGKSGIFGRRRMIWLCYEESLRRGEGLITYDGKPMTVGELRSKKSPVFFDHYKAGDGNMDGFLRLLECSQ